MNQIEAAWSLLEKGHLQEARSMSEKLVRRIANELEDHESDRELLHQMALACHVAGFLVGLSVRSPYAATASSYFDEMLHAARQLRDTSLCVEALCFRGDCARRYGDPHKAKRTLQLAYRIDCPDPEAHGKSAQMLARLCGQQEEEQFRHLMGEASQIAATLPPQTSLPGQLFCEGALLIDSCSYYRHVGAFEQARESLAQAEKILPDTPYWKSRLTAAQGLLLVHSGDLEGGMPHVILAVELANEQGDRSLLEQLASLQSFLGRRCIAYNKANVRLGEALHGRF